MDKSELDIMQRLRKRLVDSLDMATKIDAPNPGVILATLEALEKVEKRIRIGESRG